MSDGQPLIEKYQSDVAAALRRMADHVDLNKSSNSFAGCAVIIPPEGGGDTIEMLILDTRGDVAQFYATISSRITMRVSELQDQQRRAQGFGVR